MVEAARAISLVFAGLVVLAVAHKVRILHRGTERYEPVIATRGRLRDHARAVLALAAAAELATAGLLVDRPAAGFSVLAILTLVYAAALRTLPSGAGCNCFGDILETGSRSAAIARNVSIAAVSLAATSGYASGWLRPEALSGETIGIALVVWAAVAAPWARRMLLGGVSVRGGDSHGFQ